jgi:RNA polymerase sigma factor (sigma-70 family)
MEFELLVKKISKPLKGIIYKIKTNNEFNFFDEEDLYQEALLHLFEEFKTGNLNNKNESYILQNCYFYLKNYIRKNCKKMNYLSLEQIKDNNGEKFYFNENEKYSEFIYEKILIDYDINKKLTEREREIVKLSLEGLTTREIGKRLGISHVMVIKIKKKLRKFFY